jgi:hypothetical protein
MRLEEPLDYALETLAGVSSISTKCTRSRSLRACTSATAEEPQPGKPQIARKESPQNETQPKR